MTHTPHHHLSPALIHAYSVGDLPEAVAVFVACHLTLCPACRAEEESLSSAGGELLAALPAEPAADPDADLAALLARLDEPEPPEAAPVPPPTAPHWLPAPLRAVLPELSWKTLAPGRMWTIPLPMSVNGVTPRLIRLAAGTTVPAHAHRGTELIQVFSGGYSDRGEQHLRGDVAINDADDDHTVRIDGDGECVFLYVSDGPLEALTERGERVMAFLSR